MNSLIEVDKPAFYPPELALPMSEAVATTTGTRSPARGGTEGNHHHRLLSDEEELALISKNSKEPSTKETSNRNHSSDGEVVMMTVGGSNHHHSPVSTDKQVLVSEQASKELPNNDSSSTEQRSTTREWQDQCRQSPLKLLSPLKTPDDKHWGEQLSRRREMEENKRASPANGWPQRSPIHPDPAHDVASFILFTQSFDTLSETGTYIRNHMDQTNQKDRNYNYSSPQPKRKYPRDEPPRKIDLSLRDHDAESSVGDISPIKLDDHIARGYHPQSPERRQLYHESYHQRNHSHHSFLEARTPYDGHPDYRGGPPYHQRPTSSYDGQQDGCNSGFPNHPNNPFYVLRSAHRAFEGCSYILPCVRDRDICPVNLSQNADIRHYHDQVSPDSRDINIATRRVEAAIHAFGGFVKPKQMLPHRPTSIFRLKGHRKTPSKEFYDDRFHDRYFVNDNHISWELEENPPIISSKPSRHPPRRTHAAGHDDQSPDYIDDQSYHSERKSTSGGDCSFHSTSSVISPDNQKMKYRCKLCGQLKQNHNCPYQQSLQRSIGVMVQPAVNAFTAREPGMLTKSLSEMNNFVSYDHNSLETDHPRRVNIQSVTPETNKTRLLHSPESSLSTHSADPSPPGADWSNDRKRSHVHVSTDVPEPTIRLKKQPFVEPLALRSEQYRAVTPKPKTKELVNANDFHYPPVPLTFKERKRLTDTLFCLSQGVPSMMRDVAALLRPARKKEEWDLAVAEVLTQVVVGVYCTEGDHRLDGLQHFLLGIGISC